MKEWKVSNYTSKVLCESGELILHNSFMGAIACIPVHEVDKIDRFIQEGISEQQLSDSCAKELCEEGFFVLRDLDECQLVSDILDKERESGFNLIILPHENCNFRCDYCYEKFERGKMEREVIDSLKIFIERKVLEWSSLSVAWFGGEPLLAQDVIYELSEHLLSQCNRYNISYTSSIITNGYLLTKRVVDKLLGYKIKKFQVTIDGHKTVHDSLRKLNGTKGTYDRIVDNLKCMRSLGEDFSVRLRVNFNDQSLPLMDEFLTEFSKLFAEDSRFEIVFCPIGKWGGPNDGNFSVSSPDSGLMNKIKLTARSLKLGFSDLPIKGTLSPHGYVCYASKEESLVVRTDGTLCKCTMAREDPLNQVGKLTKDGQLQINRANWDLWVGLNDKNINKCHTCRLSPTCQGRMCPLDTIRKKTPPCPRGKIEYETMIKLVAGKGII